MAYSVDKVRAVESWTAASEFGDDIALDVDVTTCMTNGTTGEDCDEWKEGTLNVRVEIDANPSAITALSIQFYLNSVMSAGNNTVVPYTDANSVSATYGDEQDYSSAGSYIQHATLGSNFISELGDLGGYCAIRLASEGAAKSKLGEVQIDATVTQETITGITKDTAGDALGSCKVSLFKITSEGPPETYEFIESTTSHVSTGAYTFTIDANSDKFMVYSEKDDSPHVFDATDNVIESS